MLFSHGVFVCCYCLLVIVDVVFVFDVISVFVTNIILQSHVGYQSLITLWWPFPLIFFLETIFSRCGDAWFLCENNNNNCDVGPCYQYNNSLGTCANFNKDIFFIKKNWKSLHNKHSDLKRKLITFFISFFQFIQQLNNNKNTSCRIQLKVSN